MKVSEDLRQKVFDEMARCLNHVNYEDIVKWIDDNYNNKSWSHKVKNPICKATTYGLKHSIEKYFHGYCSNNACKLALIELGFDVYPCNLLTGNYNIIRSLLGNENYITEKYLCNGACNFIFKRNKYFKQN